MQIFVFSATSKVANYLSITILDMQLLIREYVSMYVKMCIFLSLKNFALLCRMLLRFVQKMSLRSLFSQGDKVKVALAHFRSFYFIRMENRTACVLLKIITIIYINPGCVS